MAAAAAVVEYKGWKEGYRCGYCGSERGKVSAGKRRDGATRASGAGAGPPSLNMEEHCWGLRGSCRSCPG